MPARPAPRLARRLRPWLGTAAALAVATAALFAGRGRLDKAHVALAYLLVVLGASARGGRALGLAAAGAAFLLFDVLFLPPYGALAVADPLDWLVLAAFLAAGTTAAQLFERARREAAAARARAADVDRIAALGARALAAGGAAATLAAVADAVREALALDRCDAWPAEALAGPTDGHGGDAAPAAADAPPLPPTVLLAAESAALVAERRDGTVRVAGRVGAFAQPAAGLAALGPGAPDGAPDGANGGGAADGAAHDSTRGDAPGAGGAGGAGGDGGAPSGVRAALGALDPADVTALVLPLAVRDPVPHGGGARGARLVGALRLARAAGFPARDAAWRTLDALAHHAALAADRVRLAGAEERAAVLAEAGRLKDALMAAVSHDLRTPLTTIKATAQQLGAALPDPDAAERAQVIEQEADRLARLVADLLDFSRLGAGAMPLDVQVNAADDLLDVVRQRVEGALGDPARGGRALEVALPPGAPLLLGTFDLAASARVLVNLVENAHKYAPPGTPVEVRARAEGGRLLVDVCDRGPGVPAAERDRVFEPFSRGALGRPGGTADAGGVGLGLAIARQLAEAQGGGLTYAPRAGGGSVFTLAVPAAEVGEADDVRA